jgi:mRNA interferase HigB
MRIISRRPLREFQAKHAAAVAPLERWYRIALHASWTNLAETRQDFPHADSVGDVTIFNIRGNHYRLISRIDYRRQKIYVMEVLTHAEYDRRYAK